MPMPRLFAEPVQKIDLSDASGWLYRWDNGETQMLWIVPPSPKRLEELDKSLPLHVD